VLLVGGYVFSVPLFVRGVSKRSYWKAVISESHAKSNVLIVRTVFMLICSSSLDSVSLRAVFKFCDNNFELIKKRCSQKLIDWRVSLFAYVAVMCIYDLFSMCVCLHTLASVALASTFTLKSITWVSIF
jgi:hypothetical protein